MVLLQMILLRNSLARLQYFHWAAWKMFMKNWKVEHDTVKVELWKKLLQLYILVSEVFSTQRKLPLDNGRM